MEYSVILGFVAKAAAYVLLAVGVLVVVTTLIVEVVKGLLPKLPTNILAFAVAMIVTAASVAIVMAYAQIAFQWWYILVTVVLGFFVAYAAMFGFDKFKQIFSKLPGEKEKE